MNCSENEKYDSRSAEVLLCCGGKLFVHGVRVRRIKGKASLQRLAGGISRINRIYSTKEKSISIFVCVSQQNCMTSNEGAKHGAASLGVIDGTTSK